MDPLLLFVKINSTPRRTFLSGRHEEACPPILRLPERRIFFGVTAQVYGVDEMSENDPRLLQAARHGDERAFLALYHSYRTPNR
jgi:hypothetical protein